MFITAAGYIVAACEQTPAWINWHYRERKAFNAEIRGDPNKRTKENKNSWKRMCIIKKQTHIHH